LRAAALADADTSRTPLAALRLPRPRRPVGALVRAPGATASRAPTRHPCGRPTVRANAGGTAAPGVASARRNAASRVRASSAVGMASNPPLVEHPEHTSKCWHCRASACFPTVVEAAASTGGGCARSRDAREGSGTLGVKAAARPAQAARPAAVAMDDRMDVEVRRLSAARG